MTIRKYLALIGPIISRSFLSWPDHLLILFWLVKSSIDFVLVG